MSTQLATLLPTCSETQETQISKHYILYKKPAPCCGLAGDPPGDLPGPAHGGAGGLEAPAPLPLAATSSLELPHLIFHLLLQPPFLPSKLLSTSSSALQHLTSPIYSLLPLVHQAATVNQYCSMSSSPPYSSIAA